MDKEDIYGNLDIKGITDLDYKHAKRVCKDFRLHNVSKYTSKSYTIATRCV